MPVVGAAPIRGRGGAPPPPVRSLVRRVSTTSPPEAEARHRLWILRHASSPPPPPGGGRGGGSSRVWSRTQAEAPRGVPLRPHPRSRPSAGCRDLKARSGLGSGRTNINAAVCRRRCAASLADHPPPGRRPPYYGITTSALGAQTHFLPAGPVCLGCPGVMIVNWPNPAPCQ